jgi:hypothetical protein
MHFDLNTFLTFIANLITAWLAGHTAGTKASKDQ